MSPLTFLAHAGHDHSDPHAWVVHLIAALLYAAFAIGLFGMAATLTKRRAARVAVASGLAIAGVAIVAMV
jgi:4-amino-4-deoxy-L-arabinose transferase-like glycosyltransferase